MIERLDAIEQRYNDIQAMLSTQAILHDYLRLKALSKESKSLEPTVKKYNEYKKIEEEIEQAQFLMKDEANEDFLNLAKEELESLKEKLRALSDELEVMLVPTDEYDGRDIIIEIRGAAGGDEANLFAGDLYRMYTRYAEKHNWKVEEIHSVPGASGGYAQIEAMIKGEDVYKNLKYESGAHRVQRVPVTETQGRIHTSTATVLVMPEVTSDDIELNENDIKMDVYHSSGAGGQSVNTSNSAVRLTHIPTGISVACQIERSQLRNKEKAMELLKIKVNDEKRRAEEEQTASERRSKIGTGDRSEKIRTYNYPQNRVTDHRINFSVMNLDKVMDGDLDPIIEALQTEDLKLKMAGSTSDVKPEEKARTVETQEA